MEHNEGRKFSAPLHHDANDPSVYDDSDADFEVQGEVCGADTWNDCMTAKDIGNPDFISDCVDSTDAEDWFSFLCPFG